MGRSPRPRPRPRSEKPRPQRSCGSPPPFIPGRAGGLQAGRGGGRTGGTVCFQASRLRCVCERVLTCDALIRLHTDSVTLAFCVAPVAPSPQPRWPGRALISPPASGRSRRPPSAAGPGAGHRPLLPLLRQTRPPAAQASLLPPA